MRKDVNCSMCGKSINRQTWNYGKNREMISFFCDNTCKGLWQKKQREDLGFTKEWLESEYHEKGKSADQIASEIGRDPKSVWRWIKEYGLKTRPRGTDYGQCFVAGEESAFKGKKHSKETREKLRKARLDDGHVPYLINGVHWLHATGRKPAIYKGGITPERQSFYSTPEWADCVKMVWQRDNATCKKCGKKHNTKEARGTFHIHHIVSFMVKEKRADVDNLVLLCRKCHLFVHSRKNKNNEFIKEY